MSDQTKPAADTHQPEDDGNFLHVVIYAGIFLVIGLIAAFFILKVVGRQILPGKHTPHPTSQLVLPGGDNISIAAAGAAESPFIFRNK
ncbi:MAG TPA: hypothetical protein VGU67_04130 [Edaphobacter sp.]|nr:hypothetical protein [Edaphobacter sp.]